MSTQTCPNGHVSGDPEWCDTCGAPMTGSPDPSATPDSSAAPGSTPPAGPTPGPTSASSTGAAPPCPHCGVANPADNLFCESCGYDFTTGQAPEPLPDPVAPAEPVAATGPAPWVLVVEIDPAWFALKGELSDQACPPPSTSTIQLTQHTSMIGRSSQSRGLRPEVALDGDTAVSRRHAQLVLDGTALTVVDLSSTNGTYVMGSAEEPTEASQPLAPGVAAIIHDGDRIYVGAWTRLTARTQ